MKSFILSYRMGLAHSCNFGDEDKLRQHLLVLVNHILSKAMETVKSTNHKEGVDYCTVLRHIFEVAVVSSYPTEGHCWMRGREPPAGLNKSPHFPFSGFEWNNPIPNPKFRDAY